MANHDELYQALRNADAAGDVEGARKLASYIQSMPAETKPAAPKAEERSLLSNVASGVASGFADIGDTLLNAGTYLPGKVIPAVKKWNDERSASLKDFNDERKDSTAFNLSRIAGNVAATAPVGGVLGAVAKTVAPGAVGLANALTSSGMRAGSTPGVMNMLTRMAGGALTGGTSAALVNPEDAGTGAAIGAVLPPALSGLNKVGQIIGNKLTLAGANDELAKKAIQQYGIPLGIADVSPNGTVKALRSVLNDAPLSGGIGAAQREGVQEGFNKAVGGTFGAPESKLTADVVDAAKKRMGAEFDRIWNQNSLAVDGELIGKMMALQEQAAKLPKNEGASLLAEINDLFSKMTPDGNGGMTIAGETANKFQSYLRRRAEGSAGLKNELGDLRQGIISAFNRGIRPEDAAALTQNRAQYKAFKTVEPLLNGAEAGVAGRMPGDVPAGLLPQAVARQYSQAAGTQLGDLAQIGSRFIVDRTPRTGGSMRAALQNVGIGAGLVGAGTVNPLLAIGAIPVAAGANALLGSPAVAQHLLSSGQPNRLAQLLTSPEVAQLTYRSAPALSASR